MARDGQSRTRNVRAAAGRELLRELDTRKRPTNLLRTLVALLLLYKERDSRWFASDDVMDTVNEHANENEEKLGPRTELYVVKYSMNILERKGYLCLEEDGRIIKLRKAAAEMMERIIEQTDSQSLSPAMTRHRALCDHFRQRIGPMKRPTYSELDCENRELRQSISDHKRLCTYDRFQSPASDSDTDDPMDTTTDSATYMDQPTSTTLQELIAGPSNPASVFPASPVRKLLLTDLARTAYPSPESLPRPRVPRSFSSSPFPPASPTPRNRTSGSPDGDLDVEAGLEPLEDLRKRIKLLQEQNDALEKETKQINIEKVALSEQLKEVLKKLETAEEELKRIRGELEDQGHAIESLEEQISTLKRERGVDADTHKEEQKVLSDLLKQSKEETMELRKAFIDAAKARIEQEKQALLALGLEYPS